MKLTRDARIAELQVSGPVDAESPAVGMDKMKKLSVHGVVRKSTYRDGDGEEGAFLGDLTVEGYS